jgi:hypothetical protein
MLQVFPNRDSADEMLNIPRFLALVCSSINVAFASWTPWRAQDLEGGFWGSGSYVVRSRALRCWKVDGSSR